MSKRTSSNVSENTPHLALPYIMAAQAQKHVTHNEALTALDALVQLSATSRMLATPPAFIAVLAGLAMLKVLQGSLTTAFNGKCALGALITFLVTLANLPILSLGAPFWGLLFGCIVSWMLERDDYVAQITHRPTNNQARK